jgi:hypothetical protein
MVLAASNEDHTQVELVTPPADTQIGERVFVEGYPGEPDEQLNPKQKVFETVAVVRVHLFIKNCINNYCTIRTLNRTTTV